MEKYNEYFKILMKIHSIAKIGLLYSKDRMLLKIIRKSMQSRNKLFLRLRRSLSIVRIILRAMYIRHPISVRELLY